ncbi:VCBS domain-containing protein, partial [Sphingomonas sp. BN140010]
AANGSYTYSVANSATQYLQANETKIDTFTVTALDGTTKQVSFTINGANEVNSAVNDKLVVSTNTIATFSTSVLTGNDLQQLAVVAMAISGSSSNGALAFDKLSQTFTYSSTSGTGAAVDTLTYTLSDGSTGTVSLDVVNANPGFDLKAYVAGGSYQGAYLDAAGGNDTVNGASASDTLIGGDGNDTLVGDTGSDILRGGAGNDTLDGQGANGDFDLIDFSDGNAGLNFTLVQSASNTTFVSGAAVGLGTDTYRNMEGVIGTNFADILNGSSSADILKGGGGNDTINGNDGDDFIYGGAGDDNLNGGLGKDTFVYEGSGLGTDTITGFISGTDKIDLKIYGISFADVQSTSANNVLTLAIDTDHNGTSDLIIKLNATSAVSASDFIF